MELNFESFLPRSCDLRKSGARFLPLFMNASGFKDFNLLASQTVRGLSRMAGAIFTNSPVLFS